MAYLAAHQLRDLKNSGCKNEGPELLVVGSLLVCVFAIGPKIILLQAGSISTKAIQKSIMVFI